MKRFRILYLGSHCQSRFVAAKTMLGALNYAIRHDIRCVNAFGDTIGWGEIERIELWDDAYPLLDDSSVEEAA